MHRILSGLIFVVVGVFTVFEVQAQEVLLPSDSSQQTQTLRYIVGVYGGLGFNLHSASFGQLPGVPSCCDQYKDATSVGPAFGLMGEFPLSKNLRLQTRLGYASLSGTLTRTETIGNEPVLDDGPVPTPVRRNINVEHSIKASLPMAVFEPTLSYRLLDFFWISAGARVGFLLSKEYEQKEVLFNPDGYVFTSGSAIRNVSAGPIPDAKSLQMHGVLGLGYELLTRSNISIIPEVRYYLPFTNIGSVDWNVQGFQIGLTLRYGIYSPIDPTIKRDTIIKRDTTVVQKPGLRTDIVRLDDKSYDDESRTEGDFEYYTTTITEHYIRETPRPFAPIVGVKIIAEGSVNGDAAGQQLRIEELDVLENYPLLPQIFFSDNSSSLDSTTQMLTDLEQARDFRSKDLTRNQIDVYRNVLNVIGYRMKSDPKPTITVTGCTNNADAEQNNTELAKRRAESVKNYLVDVWGIDPSRVNTTHRLLPTSPANPATLDGKQENSRAEISTSDVALLEPVEFRDKDLIVKPPKFKIVPNIEEGRDITDYDLTLKQKSVELIKVHEKGQPETVKWNADQDGTRPKNDAPIIANLTVHNEIGQSASATDTLMVDYATVQLMKMSTEGGKMIERYSLIVFDFNSAQLNASNQRVMQRIKERIQPESKVKILGYADRQGNPEYNRTLARKRCVEAQRVLGLADDRVTIEPVGNDRLLFDNDLPEGRSYSRTVQIEIETPVR
ncbi:MAG: OmpA family protein [Ignavibacteria bacterium]|nr:OmpA family protein [Ignavibacteria bacterium]